MSQDELKIGKLTPVDLRGASLEEKCKQICIHNDKDHYIDCFDSYADIIECELQDEYFVYGNTLFSVHIESEDINDNIYQASRDDDGVINFIVKYYNGSMPFSEALEEAIKTIPMHEAVK